MAEELNLLDSVDFTVEDDVDIIDPFESIDFTVGDENVPPIPSSAPTPILFSEDEVDKEQEKTQFPIIKTIKDRKLDIGSLKFSILGWAFKGIPETNDLRGSMTFKLYDELKEFINPNLLTIYDPVTTHKELKQYFPKINVAKTLSASVQKADVVIIANNHSEFGKVAPSFYLEKISKQGFIYDLWNHFSNYRNKKELCNYFALGNVGIK